MFRSFQTKSFKLSALKHHSTKLSDGLGGGGGAPGALTNSRDARTDGGEVVRCSALVRRLHSVTVNFAFGEAYALEREV